MVHGLTLCLPVKVAVKSRGVLGVTTFRADSSDSKWVFPGDGDNAFLATSLNHQHSKIRDKVGLQKDFVLHSFRHSMPTRLGEVVVDAFKIMRIAGHSSVKVSERYVHPGAEALECAFERLEAFSKAPLATGNDEDQRLPATVSATLEDLIPAGHQETTLIQ
jgi:Phage integrase family